MPASSTATPASPAWRARVWARKKWPRPLARATSPLRQLPGFFVLGEMKCGTTSLFAYLGRHPKVLEPYRKEPFFFDRRYDRGWRWYRSNFPITRPGTLTGDASAYYFIHPLARHRIRAYDPGTRLIVLLRDPVERTLSHYHHSRSKGREPLSFEAALDAEDERLAGEVERIVADPSYESFAHINHSYAARSRYADQLEAWLKVFPREQLLVLSADDLFVDAGPLVSEALRFLGLPGADLSPYPPLNTREYEPMAPATRERLEAHFAEPNRRLYELLGRDLGWPA